MRSGYYVADKLPFKGHNLYGLRFGPNDSCYVVYSYGEHWPLWLWVDNHWFGNKSRYSVTTSKHRSHSWPRGVGPEEITWLDIQQIREAARKIVALPKDMPMAGNIFNYLIAEEMKND